MPQRRENFVRGAQRTSNAGRKPGVPNRHNQLLKDAMMLAADQVGYMRPRPQPDGEDDNLNAVMERWLWDGTDGVVGFLRFCCVHYPRDYLRALTKLLPLQINMAGNVTRTFRTIEEIRDDIRSRGLPLDDRLLGKPTRKPMKTINAKRGRDYDDVDEDDYEDDYEDAAYVDRRH